MREKGWESGNAKGLPRRLLWWSQAVRICGTALVFLLFIGCAPALYSVDMRYRAAGGFPQAEAVSPPVSITVAAFQDLRKVDDPITIGRVITARGEEIRVFPKFMKPSEAVTAPFKDFFRQAGFSVAAESPSWDLTEGNIRKEGDTILVGGSIDELEILCRRSMTVQKYTAKAKLTLYVADRRQQKVRYKVTAESSDSLDHVLFSEEKLEQQLNIAVAEAINKILEDKKLVKIIQEIATEQHR